MGNIRWAYALLWMPTGIELRFARFLPIGFRVCAPERGHAVTPFTRRCDFGHKIFFNKKLNPGFDSPPRKRSNSKK
jgi:hypothetical protein